MIGKHSAERVLFGSGHAESPRALALDILVRLDAKGGHAKLLIDDAIVRSGLRAPDKGLLMELVYGVLRHRNKLDCAIGSCSTRPSSKLGLRVSNILRLGIYQLLQMDRVPDYAAIDESVELAKRFCNPGAAKLVNAVLRRACRERDGLIFPSAGEDILKHISVVYSHPEWLVARWLTRYGSNITIDICKANNEAPLIALRANTLRISAECLASLLRPYCASVEKSPLAPEGLRIRPKVEITEMRGFKEGLFFVQDESSMVASRILAPSAGQRVLDCCAAPGGKATHIAQLMGDSGEIVALDRSPDRIALLAENCKRLGLKSIRCAIADAADFGGLKCQFDSVIVDAPCSGLGLLRRFPEGRWQKKPEQIEMYAKLQSGILSNVLRFLKRGGALVYCTCSNEPEENRLLIERFLAEKEEFRRESAADFLPRSYAPLVDSQGYFESLPCDFQLDGFFAALLRKR